MTLASAGPEWRCWPPGTALISPQNLGGHAHFLFRPAQVAAMTTAIELQWLLQGSWPCSSRPAPHLCRGPSSGAGGTNSN